MRADLANLQVLPQETVSRPGFLLAKGTKGSVKALLGTKLGMTQIINNDGSVVAVTLVHALPNVITQLKTEEKDGYSATQMTLPGSKSGSKAMQGHLKKADKKMSAKAISEIRGTLDTAGEDSEELKVGSSFDVSNFAVGDVVKVTGTSKGKGFAGNIKRHNFNASARTHGGKGDVRKPGSIGSMYPQKIFKGKRMAGQMGNSRVTVSNLTVALVDAENNLIGLKGAIPGPKKAIVKVVGA